LEVWKNCKDLRDKLSIFARTLPSDKKIRLSDQIIRAARSVTNNLAEGYGRFHYQANIKFCRQSRGSLYEIVDCLDICLNENYLTEKEFLKYREECLRGIQLINGYIRFLSKQKEASQ